MAIAGAPAWAVSVSSPDPLDHLAQPAEGEAMPKTVPAPAAFAAPGSSALVPLMAADAASHEFVSVDAVDAPATGGLTSGSIDDIEFLAAATQTGLEEIQAARHAIPQLRDPRVREVAAALIAHHESANRSLADIAADKGWPVPTANTDAPIPAGTATPDFDDRWTDEAILEHERAIALYRAQAEGGEDRELRRYARESLPALQRHLDLLRSLQK